MEIPIRIPNKSETDNQKYSLNVSEEIFFPSKFIPAIISNIEIKEIIIKMRDSLCLLSPIANIETESNEDILHTTTRKVGKNINQKLFTSEPSYIGVKSAHCIKQNQIKDTKTLINPIFLSLLGSLPTGTFPEKMIK